MNAATSAKPDVVNTLEGIALSALLQWFPNFSATVMILKLAHDRQIASDPGGAVTFVVLASLLSALLGRWLGPRFPRLVKHGYEPAFFDASLSCVGKLAAWRERPTTCLQLQASVLMLSLLAVGVVSMG
jgi:hypothetical protein